MNNLELSLDNNIYKPGKTLTAELSWIFEDSPRSLYLNLFWYTEGRGTQDIGVIRSIEIEQSMRQGTRIVNFDLPEMPLSFSGSLISIVWAVEAVSEKPDLSNKINFLLTDTEREKERF